MKKEYIIDRLEKAICMGFILDKESNEYLGKNFVMITVDYPIKKC